MLSKIISEFYGNIKDTRQSKLIKVKRLTNLDKQSKDEVSIIKGRIKNFQEKLQDDRKSRKQKKFNANRNFQPIVNECKSDEG